MVCLLAHKFLHLRLLPEPIIGTIKMLTLKLFLITAIFWASGFYFGWQYHRVLENPKVESLNTLEHRNAAVQHAIWL